MLEKVIVTVKEGKVRGFKTSSAYSGVEYYSFLAIPYGQSTSRLARYKDPVPVKPWSALQDATVEKGGCYQMSLMKRRLTGTEDCLYNNIYTPKIPSKRDSLKAVIVAYHPGGLIHGDPDPSCYGAPDFIMHHNVVYVAVGFRMHVLGFLNLNMKDCSGNQAVKDIILSLKWIKENIAVFGGDPENITIMGTSSGAMLVHFLLLSPLAEGLYHKAVIMGMYAFNPVVIMSPEHSSTAYEYAKKMGYQGKPDDEKKLLNFYKKIDLTAFLISKPEHYLNDSAIQIFPISPFTITEVPEENSPFPEPLEKLIPSTNRVPLMIGFCEKEGCMALARHQIMKMPLKDCFYKVLSQNCFGWGANLNDDELTMIQKEVEDYYLAGKSIETAPDPLLCDILTDIALSDVYDSLINVISADLPSSVYVYNFFYDGDICMMKRKLAFLLEREFKGAFHAADFSYWNYMKESSGKNMELASSNDRQTIDTFTSLVTTFAKTSDPNYEGMPVKWKPTTPSNPSHLIIDESLKVEDRLLNGERMEFWHKLKNKYRKERKNV